MRALHASAGLALGLVSHLSHLSSAAPLAHIGPDLVFPAQHDKRTFDFGPMDPTFCPRPSPNQERSLFPITGGSYYLRLPSTLGSDDFFASADLVFVQTKQAEPVQDEPQDWQSWMKWRRHPLQTGSSLWADRADADDTMCSPKLDLSGQIASLELEAEQLVGANATMVVTTTRSRGGKHFDRFESVHCAHITLVRADDVRLPRSLPSCATLRTGPMPARGNKFVEDLDYGSESPKLELRKRDIGKNTKIGLIVGLSIGGLFCFSALAFFIKWGSTAPSSKQLGIR